MAGRGWSCWFQGREGGLAWPFLLSIGVHDMSLSWSELHLLAAWLKQDAGAKRIGEQTNLSSKIEQLCLGRAKTASTSCLCSFVQEIRLRNGVCRLPLVFETSPFTKALRHLYPRPSGHGPIFFTPMPPYFQNPCCCFLVLQVTLWSSGHSSGAMDAAQKIGITVGNMGMAFPATMTHVSVFHAVIFGCAFYLFGLSPELSPQSPTPALPAYTVHLTVPIHVSISSLPPPPPRMLSWAKSTASCARASARWRRMCATSTSPWPTSFW